MEQNNENEAETGKVGEFFVGCIGWILIGPLIKAILFYPSFFLANLFNTSTAAIVFHIIGVLALLYLNRSWVVKGRWVLYGAFLTMLVNILGLLYSFKMNNYFGWNYIVMYGPFIPFFMWLMPIPN